MGCNISSSVLGLLSYLEDPLEKGMVAQSSILAWRIPRTEEPGGLQFMGSHRVRHDWAHTHTNCCCCCRPVTQSCLTLRDPMDYSKPGFPILHHLLELAQTYVHRVGDATQPSHLLPSPSPPVFNLSRHQGFSQWVCSSHKVAKVLEFQLQHQSFQRICSIDPL